jgi:hypothetical protein
LFLKPQSLKNLTFLIFKFLEHFAQRKSYYQGKIEPCLAI